MDNPQPKKTKEDRVKEKKDRKKVKSKLQIKKDKPNSTYWRTKADTVFMAPAHDMPCSVCEAVEGIVYHHIIEKSRCRAMRYNLMNVIPLCQNHHCFSNELAPHSNKSIAVKRWWDWLKESHLANYVYCKDNEHEKCKYTYRDKYFELIGKEDL